MPMPQVTGYYVYWDLDGHYGNVQVNLSNNLALAVGGQTPEEMHMLVDLLRNEEPIYCDVTARRLIVGLEPTGEGES